MHINCVVVVVAVIVDFVMSSNFQLYARRARSINQSIDRWYSSIPIDDVYAFPNLHKQRRERERERIELS